MAATNSAACSRSRRVLRTPYRLRHRPATRRCGLILKSARVAGLAGRCHPQAWWQPPVIRTGTVSAASLAAVAFRRPAHRLAASQAPCVPVRTPTFPHPQCGSRRQRQSACHNAGRGRGRRAAGARSLRVDTRPCPHARRPDRLPHAAPARLQIYYRFTASMYFAAPVKRGGPRSRIRAPTRHERASPHPSRKWRFRGRKPLTRKMDNAAKICGSTASPAFRHAGFRCAAALRGMAWGFSPNPPNGTRSRL